MAGDPRSPGQPKAGPEADGTGGDLPATKHQQGRRGTQGLPVYAWRVGVSELCRQCAWLHHGSDPHGIHRIQVCGAMFRAPMANSPRIIPGKRDRHSFRASPEKEDDRVDDRKPFVAIQGVRLPCGKGQPSGSEPCLGLATEFLKRRQQVLKPSGKSRYTNARAFVVDWAGAAPRRSRDGEAASVRPGSWSWAEAQDGLPGNLRDPVPVRVRGCRQWTTGETRDSGSGRHLPPPGSAAARHERGE
jgi:hypothetical protein